MIAFIAMFITSAINAQEPEENPQWIFFKEVIPKNKSITISGSGWEMTINDKYKVSFTGSYSDGGSQNEEMYNSSFSESATFKGVGFVLWNNDRMQIKLTTYASGSYNSDATKYKYVTKTDQSAQNRNTTRGVLGSVATVLTGQDYYSTQNYENTSYTVKELDYSTSGYASGNNTISNTFSFSYSDGKLYLDGNPITLTMTGNTTRNVSMRLVGGYYPKKVAKNDSELNTSSTDEFGEWNWNNERSKIYLKSSLGDNLFVIWNRQGKLSWSMEMEKGTVGVSETTTENGDKITNLALSFDGAPAQNFSFVEYKSNPQKQLATEYKTVKVPVYDSETGEITQYRDSTYTIQTEKIVYDENDKLVLNNTDVTKNVLLDYATYNRFMGTLTKNSSSILNQIKDKQMLMLSYKVGNEEKFDMFMLEGLETILDYLSQ